MDDVSTQTCHSTFIRPAENCLPNSRTRQAPMTIAIRRVSDLLLMFFLVGLHNATSPGPHVAGTRGTAIGACCNDLACDPALLPSKALPRFVHMVFPTTPESCQSSCCPPVARAILDSNPHCTQMPSVLTSELRDIWPTILETYSTVGQPRAAKGCGCSSCFFCRRRQGG